MDSQSRKTKTKPSKVEEMTKEQIRQAILKKRECNSKAQGIVENLLEKHISEDYFLQCLPDINQSHFEDIVEERAITHICGYPICSQELSVKEIPKQKYRISMKTNKVYDISHRKNFCSNQCYQAAVYVKKQMLTSPLWFREYEEIPTFTLLLPSQPASMGQEIDVAIVEKIQQPKSFTPINDFASASLKDMTGELDNTDVDMKTETADKQNDKLKEMCGKTKDIEECVKNTSASLKDMTIKSENTDVDMKTETADQQNDKLKEICNKTKDIKITPEITKDQEVANNQSVSTKTCKRTSETLQTKPPKKVIKNPSNIVGEIIERPEQKIDPILTDTIQNKQTTDIKEKSSSKLSHKKQPIVAVLTIQVEKCLAEWFTIDTLLYLFGEERVKEMVADKGDCIKDYLNNYAKGIFYTSNSYDHYQALCRKLNMLELEDKKHDLQTLKKETKPLPDYSIIQEESKKMQLKVRAFYSGKTEVSNVETMEKHDNSEENDHVTHLPLVDKNAQNALRRKIVGQHLNKVLPDLLRSLDLLTLSISSEVHLLVNSFSLKADNITFKPIQWTLVAIVIIKLLSLRDQRLAYLLQQRTAFQHMQLLLLSYKQDGVYLDRLVSWLTDINRLLDTNDVQLTIE